MEGQILTGAYVIRNKNPEASVLQIKDAAFSSWSWVVVHEQDEIEYRDQQIWWVEELPRSGGNSEVVYSITNTSSGKALGLRGGDGSQATFGVPVGTYATASPANGAPWQRWKIRRSQNRSGGTYYTLKSVDNSQLLDVPDKKAPWCISQPYNPKRASQGWEFIVPKAAVPYGWFQIQNSKTKLLLSHDYLSNPPTLVAPPETTPPSYCHEGWNTQWTLILAKNYAPGSSIATGPHTWCIRNRLTKGFLSNTPKLGITAWESDLLAAAESTKFKDNIVIKEHTWKLDPDLGRNFDLGPYRNWKIANHKTLCLLDQVRSSAGAEVVCVNDKDTGNKIWALTPPIKNPNEDEPPPYHTSTSEAR